MATQYSTREVIQFLRERCDRADAIDAGRNPNERRLLADVLPESIFNELLPALRNAYLLMIVIAEQWNQKPFQTALTHSMEANELLAGHPASVYMRFGMFMLRLMDHLDVQNEDGSTAKDVLFDDYPTLTDAEWAALNPIAPVEPIVVTPVEPEPTEQP